MSRENARVLRRNTTALEQKAWALLRLLRDEGIAVRRQHPIGRYVADFAVMRSRVVIEIDGPLHETAENRARDAERDKALAALGWRVLRFDSKQLADELGVLAAVRAACPPSRGEGAGGGVNRGRLVNSAAPGEQEHSGEARLPAPQPPPHAGRGSAFALDGAQRRTRANRRLPPRRKS